MVYKVLSAVTGAVFGIMAAAFVVCLGFTLASPAVQQGVRDIRDGVGAMVGTAMESMDSEWDFDLGELWDDAAGSVSAALSPAGGDAVGFADTAQGGAYLQWRSAVEDPMGKVFGQTGVTVALVEGVAAGSTSAADAIASLDPSDLADISLRAASYSIAVGVNSVPSTLPGDVRAYLEEANANAREFADAVAALVNAAGALQAGDVLGSSALADCADRALGALSALEGDLSSAEALLG